MAIAISAIIAGVLSQCTQQYTDGRTIKQDGTLRPGEPPRSADERIAPNETPVRAPTAVDWHADPNAPKQSNGGSGNELTPPFERAAQTH